MESTDTMTPASSAETREEFIRTALERHEAPLIRYALGFTGHLETAREVVQDTFLRLCEQPSGSLDGHLTQWLFTVCRNRALDVQRKSQRMTICTETTEAELDRRAAAAPTPADHAATRERAATALELLADLPPNQREVVRLKFQQQLSYQEIAVVTSLTVGNVGFLLYTALRTLRQRMEKLDRLPLTPRV